MIISASKITENTFQQSFEQSEGANRFITTMILGLPMQLARGRNNSDKSAPKIECRQWVKTAYSPRFATKFNDRMKVLTFQCKLYSFSAQTEGKDVRVASHPYNQRKRKSRL